MTFSNTLKLGMNDSQKGCIPGMFTLTATVHYSLLRKLWSNGVAQEMPRSCLVIHVLIADVDVLVLTLEKSMAGADL